MILLGIGILGEHIRLCCTGEYNKQRIMPQGFFLFSFLQFFLLFLFRYLQIIQV
jgi:hypothetical protein